MIKISKKFPQNFFTPHPNMTMVGPIDRYTDTTTLMSQPGFSHLKILRPAFVALLNQYEASSPDPGS